MYNAKRLLLALGISGLVLLGCKNSSENENEIDSKSSPKIENNDKGYALIQLEDGTSIELKSPKQSGNSNAPSRLTANINKDGLVILLTLDRSDTPLEDKVYEDPLEAQITLTSISNDGPLGKEAYRSFNTDKEGKEGKVKITLLSHGEYHSKGTFEGVLYSGNHKKATIKGKFNTKKKKK